MRIAHLLLLASTIPYGCRTSRATVDIMAVDAPSRPPSDDYTNAGNSVKTTFTISAISLPLLRRGYDNLDLSLRITGSPTLYFNKNNYKVGEIISIEAHRDYEIILSAKAAGSELYSTQFCIQRQTFRAQEGANTFTAPLCAKPDVP